MSLHTVYLSTGSNIGDRKNNIISAFQKISNRIGQVVRHSNIYETEAWGVQNQRGFFNQVICIRTSKSPREVLTIINALEEEMGRVRDGKWAARKIDIDILFYDNSEIEEEDLIIPHPHLQDRNFVLVPFLEIAPDLVHPKLNQSIRELYFKCTDKLNVFLN